MKKLLVSLFMLTAPLHLSATTYYTVDYEDGFRDGAIFIVVAGGLFYLGVPQAIVKISFRAMDRLSLDIERIRESRRQSLMQGNFKKLVDALERCQDSNKREECLMSNKVNKGTIESAIQSNDFKTLKIKTEHSKESLDLYYKIMQTLQQWPTEKASSK